MTSVTQILDYLTEPELIKWIENNSKAKRKAISDSALDLGIRVDKLVQDDIRDGGYLCPEEEPIKNCMKAWESFKKDHPEFVPSIVSMQKELVQDELVGHPDFLHINGITDLKTSNSIWPKYWTQTAKYLDMSNIKQVLELPEFIAILRLDKLSGLYEYKKIEDSSYIDYEIEVFEAYRIAYDHAFKNREVIRQILEKEIYGIS